MNKLILDDDDNDDEYEIVSYLADTKQHIKQHRARDTVSSFAS